MFQTLLEVCVDSVASALHAQEGGADRVELCANLFEGGVTPSQGLISVVRAQLRIGLQVMLRPRGGDFLYSDLEYAAMQQDLQVAKELGADGVVLGLLLPDGSVDRQRTKELVALARPMQVTFHRAFDMAVDPFQALEDLKHCGVDCVLTSGQERTALEGMDLIAALVEHAGSDITIMAGGGIKPHNLPKLVAHTRVREYHVSARNMVPSQMKHQNARVSMGGALQLPEYALAQVDPVVVQAYRTSIT